MICETKPHFMECQVAWFLLDAPYCTVKHIDKELLLLQAAAAEGEMAALSFYCSNLGTLLDTLSVRPSTDSITHINILSVCLSIYLSMALQPLWTLTPFSVS
jgi:hypothetical protein